MRGEFAVYILANVRGRHPVLYVGVSSDIERRLEAHRTQPTGFVALYRTTTLVYMERTLDPSAAIAREKQIKGWTRAKKLALITLSNPTWRDLGTLDER